MNYKKLQQQWLQEERAAQMRGWDFSHLKGRYEEIETDRWDYKQAVLEELAPWKKLLDMDTGGGEFLLSLGHPPENTSATEGYSPNVSLCRSVLLPLGIHFCEAVSGGTLPFADGSFDVVCNRHGAYDAKEVFRVLKPGGVFLTQQVGAKNDRELVDLLLPGTPLPYPEQFLACAAQRLADAGFSIRQGLEAFSPIRFYDVGALVWFARVIPWEFPAFSVEHCLDRLYEAERQLESAGVLEGTTHRFFLKAQKPWLSD